MAFNVNAVTAGAGGSWICQKGRHASTRDSGNDSITFDALLMKSLNPSSTQETSAPLRIPEVAMSNPLDTEEEINFRESLVFVLEKEGAKHVKEDGGRGSSRYGLLQSTARAFGYGGDIRDISRREAEGIYRKMWQVSGAGKLPFPLSMVHFDTYVNSPAIANKLLRNSEGDIDTYLSMREKRYVRLAQLRPERYGRYLKGWKNRIGSLKSMVALHTREKTLAGSIPPQGERIT